jgi:hypothetical protein
VFQLIVQGFGTNRKAALTLLNPLKYKIFANNGRWVIPAFVRESVFFLALLFLSPSKTLGFFA